MAEPTNKPRSISFKIGFPWAFFWFFTIGLCNLGFWQGVWALFAWPYYLGDLARTLWIHN